ncbi:MAG: hypothetical protein PHF45_01760 [Candidatus Pacebacteria bacterium]|nr:hypothetical protein [Candidatus Paceibacterota bacterium]
MKNIPKIILVENINLDQETNLFFNFLHHPYYIQNRSFIFQTFPKLEKELEKQGEERQIIKSFISKFYSDNKSEIHKIIQKNKNLLKKKSEPSLTALLEIMDYQYDKSVVYKAAPTILPFSPFGDNVFYFSILGEIKGKPDKNILTIGIHEISHFIFLKQLKRIENKKGIILPDDVKNYLKEALAVVILNQKPLCNILNLKNYKGNPEIQNLRIEKPNGSIKTFTDFLNEYYYSIKIKEHKSFSMFLEEIINILLPIAPEFSKKRVIWNKYGKKVVKEPKIIKLYSEPIKIKNG